MRRICRTSHKIIFSVSGHEQVSIQLNLTGKVISENTICLYLNAVQFLLHHSEKMFSNMFL